MSAARANGTTRANSGVRAGVVSGKTVRRDGPLRPCDFKEARWAHENGPSYLSAKPIPYALVVTVHAKNVPDLYDRISQRYRTQLKALRPVIQIPIRSS
jgi:hypothetical protein